MAQKKLCPPPPPPPRCAQRLPSARGSNSAPGNRPVKSAICNLAPSSLQRWPANRDLESGGREGRLAAPVCVICIMAGGLLRAGGWPGENRELWLPFLFSFPRLL